MSEEMDLTSIGQLPVMGKLHTLLARKFRIRLRENRLLIAAPRVANGLQKAAYSFVC